MQHASTKKCTMYIYTSVSVVTYLYPAVVLDNTVRIESVVSKKGIQF